MSLETPALEDARTRLALSRYRRRAALLTPLGPVGVILAGMAIGPDGDPTGIRLLVTLAALGGGGLSFVLGLSGVLRSARMSVVMRRRPWASRRAWYRIAPFGANGQPALVLAASPTFPEAVCSVSTTVWRYSRLPQGADLELLVAGNPLRWAVVATPDVDDLIVIKRPLLSWWRRKLRAIALGADEPDEPTPAREAAI